MELRSNLQLCRGFSPKQKAWLWNQGRQIRPLYFAQSGKTYNTEYSEALNGGRSAEYLLSFGRELLP